MGEAMPRPLRVLMSPGPKISNPYVRMLIEHMPDDVSVAPFSWRQSIRGDYDVLHVHWPEALVRGGGRARSGVMCALFYVVQVAAKLRHKASILTVHNRRPHEGLTGAARQLAISFSRSATRRIYLTRSSLSESGDIRGVFVPHGDYLPVVAREVASIRDSEPGRIVVFGRMRPYKGVEQLIDAFASIGRPGLSLTVAGKPIDSQFAERLAALAENDRRITLRLESLSESDLVNEVTAATVAVFPYREIFNSGAVLYALSFARPVIASRSPSMAELQDEVGPEWLQLIESPVSPEGLDAAISQLAALAGKRTSHSPLRARGWTEIAQTHAMLYREVADPDDRRTADWGS